MLKYLGSVYAKNMIYFSETREDSVLGPLEPLHSCVAIQCFRKPSGTGDPTPVSCWRLFPLQRETQLPLTAGVLHRACSGASGARASGVLLSGAAHLGTEQRKQCERCSSSCVSLNLQFALNISMNSLYWQMWENKSSVG